MKSTPTPSIGASKPVATIIVQPGLPYYRVAFFERIKKMMAGSLAVYSSSISELGALSADGANYDWSHSLPPMKRLPGKLEWQPGALCVPIKRGDTLVVCGAPRALSTLMLLCRARMIGTRTLWWGHFWSPTSKPWRAVIRFGLMRLANGVIFYTDNEVEEYSKSRSGFFRQPLYALNNGIETGEIERFREKYHAFQRMRDILFIGRLSQKTKLDILLNAMSQKECDSVTLDVIGDGDHFAEFQQKAESLGLSERVVWHGAIVDESKVASIANKCRIFVFPGSVGLSLIHAFSYGLPAIIHGVRRQHGPESFAHKAGSTGEIFREGDASSLAEIIRTCLSDYSRLDEMSRNALETIKHSFNAEDMAKRFCAAIQDERIGQYRPPSHISRASKKEPGA